MFTEVLRIKPVLDESSGKQMESSLHARFARVAGRFGAGLKAVVKGSILGISLGLLNKILNPIEALDEKIKALLGKGTDIADMADRFGTTGGKLKQFQDVAQSLGVSPDQFKEVMTKFAESVEKAREEIANPLLIEKSAATVMVGQFSQQKDLAEAFKNFLTMLKTTGASKTGFDQPITAGAMKALAAAGPGGLPEEVRLDLLKRGELRHRTGAEMQAEIEKQVLGAQQFGGVKRLIGTDVEERAKTIKEPTIDVLNQTIEKIAGLDAQKQMIEVQNQTKDFIAAANNTNISMIKSLEAATARQESETTERLKTYESLKLGASAVADIQQGFSMLLDKVSEGLGLMKQVTAVIPTLTASRIFRGIFTGGLDFTRGKK